MTIATVHGDEVPLEIESADGAMTFSVHTATAMATLVTSHGVFQATANGYTTICTTPCKVTMPAGGYGFALSRPGNDPLPVEPSLSITGAARLRGTIESRSTTRTLGWIVALGGGGVGLAMIFLSSHDEQSCDSSGFCTTDRKTNQGLLLGGIVVVVASILIGDVLARTKDVARIAVLPLVAPPTNEPLPGGTGAGQTVQRAFGAPGLTIAARF